jgi:dolichol-phosphate mannosyltransferase
VRNTPGVESSLAQLTTEKRDVLRVSVVCPFYNEQDVIVTATEQMMTTLTRDFGDDWELILVNDGSIDASLRRLLELAERGTSSRLRILSFPFNQGRGRAIKAGIDAALGAVIVTTEVDGSWGDGIVRQLVNELDARPELDFVIASPHRAGGALRNVPFNRVLLTRTGNLLIRAFFGSGATMNTGMTRAYRSGVIKPLIVQADGKEFHLEVLLKLTTVGFRFAEIPATITWNRYGSAAKPRQSSTNLRRTIASHLRFLSIARPVRYFVTFAVATSLLSAAFLAAAVWVFITKTAPAVYLALIGLSMFLVSLLLTGFAVLFSEIRDAMRANLMQLYPRPHPPAARAATELFPKRVDHP